MYRRVPSSDVLQRQRSFSYNRQKQQEEIKKHQEQQMKKIALSISRSGVPDSTRTRSAARQTNFSFDNKLQGKENSIQSGDRRLPNPKAMLKRPPSGRPPVN